MKWRETRRRQGALEGENQAHLQNMEPIVQTRMGPEDSEERRTKTQAEDKKSMQRTGPKHHHRGDVKPIRETEGGKAGD